jgi:hypothetical protein
MRDMGKRPSRGEKRYRIQVLLGGEAVKALKAYMKATGIKSESAAVRQLVEEGCSAFLAQRKEIGAAG